MLSFRDSGVEVLQFSRRSLLGPRNEQFGCQVGGPLMRGGEVLQTVGQVVTIVWSDR